ncbi:MAG: DNA repair protein RecN [Bacteroidales bacterium]|nr:DNA repair protein RecN [Bacteroidales bacterium]
MLLSIQIENYALIRSTNIDFSKGFTSICGETGAGKSILLGALALVLGQRADSEVLLDKEKKCFIEAIFSISAQLKPLFEDNDLDFDLESTFRREILPSGKSRAFINDTPVSLSVMKQIGDCLVDIHSQHNTINLNDKSFQLSILDSHLEDSQLLKDYSEKFRQYTQLSSQIEKLKEQLSEFEKESSYVNFLYEELENAKLKEGEQEELQESVDLMSNSENIKTQIINSLSLFETEDYPSVITNLYEIKNNLSKIENLNKTTKELYSRTESAFIELKDIFSELQTFNDSIVFDAQLLEENSQRLDFIFKLQLKHNVETVVDLLKIKEELSNQINQNSDLEFEINKLREEENILREKLIILAKKIFNSRKKSAEKVEASLLPLFEAMGMKNAVLKIEVAEAEKLNRTAGEVEFLFNANKTIANQFRTLNKVASGGELSRLMLALKAIHLEKDNMPTLIFDEIDSGISGEIASKVALIMKNMAENRQIIAITHLPQIAAKADNQFKVYKSDIGNQTESKITLLSKEERVIEIAKMLSDENPTEAALTNSRELLS